MSYNVVYLCLYANLRSFHFLKLLIKSGAWGGRTAPTVGLQTVRLSVAIVQGDELTQQALPRFSSAASFNLRKVL